MKLTQFDPPGFLDDFTASQRQAWSEFISDSIDGAIRGFPDQLEFDGPREQFYNPLKTDTADDAQELDITWTGFPKQIQESSVSDVQRWRRADASRDVQDEYCEWSVTRDESSGKITRVTFTCEGPEYWQFLAATTPQKMVELYRQHVSPRVQEKDLFVRGRYNPRNPWNNSTSQGAMHLIQRSNTLGAEIELAAGASVVRVIDGRMLTDEQELIACGTYGEPGRNSDPHIGAMVNSLTRQKADVTLANPVGLYFSELITAGWQTPDGSDAQEYWKYVRGTKEKPVRAVFEVPPERGFVVGDILVNGRPIQFGAQIADFVNMKLTGVACRIGQSQVKPLTGCRREVAAPLGVAGQKLAVKATLEPLPRHVR
uniref:Uncharacterized protein n=1 Tax=Vitiosangium cumulatum TaxID=1867796 RepID=A0A7D5BTX8_9BACT|nr:hypothetical protein [Vitiosangium cumulatum]